MVTSCVAWIDILYVRKSQKIRIDGSERPMGNSLISKLLNFECRRNEVWLFYIPKIKPICTSWSNHSSPFPKSVGKLITGPSHASLMMRHQSKCEQSVPGCMTVADLIKPSGPVKVQSILTQGKVKNTVFSLTNFDWCWEIEHPTVGAVSLILSHF